ncbi:hypothetical protein [Aureivirga marina]|uniref:hypothetical protein n=1 Tax=Aureivirga marina TaxID=1182451 RepID=UPI0018CA37E4|nr:hypothetical protein [Aureivirga marina]
MGERHYKKLWFKIKYWIPIFLIPMFISCEDEIKNLVQQDNPDVTQPEPNKEIIPVSIEDTDLGIIFLENMKGHWIGENKVINDIYDWFSFDYRPISPSHIHGIFEGGSMGNLLTSFFITQYKGKKTLMARNGGVLSGIYRTSYFVLDSVNNIDGDYYRFVDAKGGKKIMYMELKFQNNKLNFNAYTSKLGNRLATRHMTFKGERSTSELADHAALENQFPQDVIEWNYDENNLPQYFATSEDGTVKSATYLSYTENINYNLSDLANESGDPFTIDYHTYLSYLKVNIDRESQYQDYKIFLNLSYFPLTDENGYFNSDNFNSITQFPELSNKEESFLFTYLHPGTYYITAIIDVNNDGFISSGDLVNSSKEINVLPESNEEVTITNITVQN